MHIIKELLISDKFKDSIDENFDVIRISKINLNAESFIFLHKLNTCFVEKEYGIISITSEFGHSINILENLKELDSDTSVNIKIQKKKPAFFITQKGFENFLNEHTSLQSIEAIQLFFLETSFYSLNVAFIPFDFKVLDFHRKSENINPIRFTKILDKKSQDTLASSLQDWITEENQFNNCIDSWKYISTKRLLPSLCSEISIDQDKLNLEFKGDRRKLLEINLNDKELFKDLFQMVHIIANWVFFQSKDIDVRHTFFNQQISYLIEDDKQTYSKDELKRKLKVSFENGLLAYRYYLSNSSKDLQKTLSDLNKTLFEYISKVRQNTADLSTSLWRDFTTVLAVMILNFSLKKQDIINAYFKEFAVAICVYVCISFFITANSGFWFYYGLRDNLVNWRNKLYSYLSDDEYKELGTLPLKKAFIKFRITFWIVLLSYLAIIFIVLYLSGILSVVFSNSSHTTVQIKK